MTTELTEENLRVKSDTWVIYHVLEEKYEQTEDMLLKERLDECMSGVADLVEDF